jgi:hypothetical protein
VTPSNTATRLNQSCFCIGTDVDAARAELAHALAASDQSPGLAASHAHLFSELSVFITTDQLEAMERVIKTIGAVTATTGWQQQALVDAPVSAAMDPGYESAFTAYDFHLDTNGPRLIEINTNAGGALLCASAARNLQFSESAPIDCLQSPVILANVETVFVDMLVAPFQSKYPGRPLRRIAIVDDEPAKQYLYPEFLLFRDLFQRTGIDAVIADARALVWRDGELFVDSLPIDAVYNRLTDFYLEAPEHDALKQAWLSQTVLISPHPHGHAILANKRNLVRLTDTQWLIQQGIGESQRQILLEGIPQCLAVSAMPMDWWWEHRANWFFKPTCGYGGKGTYRGSKLTRRVFNAIMSDDYIAQRFVAPSLRRTRTSDTADGTDLKVDLRCFVQGDKIILVAARLYQGQTTNFRTIGGGFAPVFAPGLNSKTDENDCSCE